jgi:hypothetical protein
MGAAGTILRTDAVSSEFFCGTPFGYLDRIGSLTALAQSHERGCEKNLLNGQRQAVPAWAAAGADIIMGGHIHLPYVRSLCDTFAGLRRDIWTVQAGTSVSSRTREGIPNSVNVLRCNGPLLPRGCTVERWDYVGRSDRFEPQTSHVLRFGAPDAA